VSSVLEKTNSKYKIEFIIVDNCSFVEDYKNLLKIFSNFNNVKLLRSVVNLGFGGGNMLGVQESRGDYIAFINNDVVFTEDCFSSLINHHNKNRFCGVSTPQQFNSNKNPTTCFDYFHGIRKELFGRKIIEFTSNVEKRKNKHYKKNISVDFIQGCFMFFSKETFYKSGGFDTNIFLYYEEMDICYRLKKIGYTSDLVPETSFIHLHGASTEKNFSIKKELKISQLYVSRKNYPYIKYLLIRLIVFVKLLFKPNSWRLIPLVLTARYLENSLKQKQSIIFL
jgi:hypothetical protein